MKIYTIIGGVNGCGKSSLTGSIKAERTVSFRTQLFSGRVQGCKMPPDVGLFRLSEPQEHVYFLGCSFPCSGKYTTLKRRPAGADWSLPTRGDRNMTRHARSPLVPSWCQVRGDRRMGLEISLRKRIRGCLCIAPGVPPSTGCFRPCGAFQCTGGKLYSCTAKRCTAPRRGRSARAGTSKEGFCNTIMRGSFWTRQRARVL